MRNRDRGLGAYIGAAIGDAMGGPVECQHSARIKRIYGEITGFLPYRKPPGLSDLHPGYALHADAGSVTDDTFIRTDLTHFYLNTRPPRTPQLLANWLLENANFAMWWAPAVEALRRIKRGEVTAQKGGLTYRQGGGVGWWTPVGILHAEDPKGAATEAKNLCRIWKAPLEQDILSAVQAGVAEGMRDGASADSIVDAILQACGPLARKLLGRGVDIGRNSRNFEDLVDKLYHNCLLNEAPTAVDVSLPTPLEPLEDTDEGYTSPLLAEQVPLALATFIFSKGDPQRAIPCACMIGRDADTIATTVGSWVGALHGESGLPKEWVDQVCRVNLKEIDIRGLGEKLLSVTA